MYIVYPDSAPENWEAQLDEMHVAWCCSPLHDKDINPTGEPKKAHWHVIVSYDSVKTPEQAAEVSALLHCPSPEVVHSIRASVRYLAHMDNPDKAAYDRADIRTYGGMEIAEYLRTSEQARGNVVRDMCRWVTENGITELYQLMQYAMDNEPDWWDALITNSGYIMDKYIASWRNGGNRK